MSLLLPALQKFYNALRNLNQFSTDNSFFDNIGCIDNFLSEYRSVSFALQTSLGRKDDPIYLKNRENILLKDESVSKWLNDQRVDVIHKHPFNLKKILRIVFYDAAYSVVLRRYEQTLENEEPIGDYLEEIRAMFSKIKVADVYFSAQYLFVDEKDKEEVNIFEIIEKGIIAMSYFLYAMKADLNENSDVVIKLFNEIDNSVRKMQQNRIFDNLDYCYYRSSDSFERAEGYAVIMPTNRFPVDHFMTMAKQMSLPIKDFYDGFIYLHAFLYMIQKHHILSTLYVEYADGTYESFLFSSSLRTTTYRYINKAAGLIANNHVVNVYFVTEAVGYGGFDLNKLGDLDKFLQLGYEERKPFRKETYLSFYKVSEQGKVTPIMINANELVDELSFSVAIGKIRTEQQPEQECIMMTPIIGAFKAKMN